jgi:hypothetical protein
VKATFKNKVGSNTGVEVRFWQDGGKDSSFHQIAPGESAFFEVNYEPVL